MLTGKVLSENHYDFTEWEVQTFPDVGLSAGPGAARSIPSFLRPNRRPRFETLARDRARAEPTAKNLLQTDPQGAKPQIEFAADLPEDSDYYIRVSASSGKAAHELDLTIDGKKAELETYDVLDPNEHLTRDVYNTPEISWYPGWHMHLSKGKHHLVFTVPDSRPTPELLLDAIALQSYKELPDPYVIPGVRDIKAEEALEDPAPGSENGKH